MKKNSGFTLIELMVTIAIVAIIAAIAVPAYTGYLATARMAEAKNNIAALQLAEEEHFLEENQYFYDNSNNNADLASASGGLWTASKGEGGVVNFNYKVTGAGTNYTITATGKVGTPVAGKTESFTKN